MTHAGYVFAGWGLGLAVIGLYAWSVIRRGRALSRHVPPQRRRWMTSDTEPDLDLDSDIDTTDEVTSQS
ncbi:MAG: hypothetical protein ACE367_06350 [Acidimicrobiales bacterium]